MAVARKSRSYTKLSLVARLHSTNRVTSRLVAKIRSRCNGIYNPWTTRCRIPLIHIFINKVHKRKKEPDKTCLCKTVSRTLYVHVNKFLKLLFFFRIFKNVSFIFQLMTHTKREQNILYDWNVFQKIQFIFITVMQIKAFFYYFYFNSDSYFNQLQNRPFLN